MTSSKSKEIASVLGWIGLGCQVVAQYFLAYHPIVAIWIMLISGLVIVTPAMIATGNRKMLVLQLVYTFFRIRTLIAWS